MDEPKRHVGDVNAGFFKQGLRLAADIFERRKGRGRAVAPYKDFVFPRGLALLLIELHKSGLAVRGFLYRCRGRVFGEEVLTRILFCRLFKQLSVEPRIKHLKRRVLSFCLPISTASFLATRFRAFVRYAFYSAQKAAGPVPADCAEF